MPVYEYACRNCGKRFEIFAPMGTVGKVRECSCGALARMVISAATVVLKGDGWATKKGKRAPK
jgi:putative FmdB family regulatory protein